MKPTCELCKKFPFDAQVYECEYRFNRRAHRCRKACQDGFIPIDETEFKFRMEYKQHEIKRQRVLYRARHREELREKARTYQHSHLDDKAEWTRKDKEKHPQKYYRRSHKWYLRHKKETLERTKFREYIEYYNPLRLILAKFRYEDEKEAGKRIRTLDQNVARREAAHEYYVRRGKKVIKERIEREKSKLEEIKNTDLMVNQIGGSIES